MGKVMTVEEGKYPVIGVISVIFPIVNLCGAPRNNEYQKRIVYIGFTSGLAELS
jgi:hypothetical protein